MNTTKNRLKNSVSRGCIGALFLFFICIGIITISFAGYQGYQALNCEHWKKTKAVIEKIDFDIVPNEDHAGFSYEVLVDYSYTVNNKIYRGDKVAFGYGLNGMKYHRELYEVLKNAAEIYIYVNPDENSESVIVRGINDSIVGVLIFSIVWNSMLLFIYLGRKKEGIRKKLFPLLAVIFLVGIALIVSNYLRIPIENDVQVIKRKQQDKNSSLVPGM